MLHICSLHLLPSREHEKVTSVVIFPVSPYNKKPGYPPSNNFDFAAVGAHGKRSSLSHSYYIEFTVISPEMADIPDDHRIRLSY